MTRPLKVPADVRDKVKCDGVGKQDIGDEDVGAETGMIVRRLCGGGKGESCVVIRLEVFYQAFASQGCSFVFFFFFFYRRAYSLARR